jgi:hypothetical protein
VIIDDDVYVGRRALDGPLEQGKVADLGRTGTRGSRPRERPDRRGVNAEIAVVNGQIAGTEWPRRSTQVDILHATNGLRR